MRFKAAAIALILALATTGTVVAAEIYKWVDAEGNMHYGDRPSGDITEQRITIASEATDPARIQQQVQAQQERAAQAAEMAAQEQDGPTKDDLRVKAEERNQKCSMYRERMERFTNSRHLYREDGDGERIYLDDGEMQDARNKVQGQVHEYCNS